MQVVGNITNLNHLRHVASINTCGKHVKRVDEVTRNEWDLMARSTLALVIGGAGTNEFSV